VLIHPGFGVPTAWAYQQLSGFPEALNGRRGRAREFIGLLQTDLLRAAPGFYNAFEAPVLRKYPLLALFQEFLRTEGAPVTLMSGSGSTTFAVVETGNAAETLIEKFRAKFRRHALGPDGSSLKSSGETISPPVLRGKNLAGTGQSR
jgi:4-diphosphocytidyl-2-C-methyl-D-erythritol kinase